MSALTVTLGADISGMKRSLGGAIGIVSSFAKRISGAFSLKGGIVGALAGGGTAALATKLNAAGEAGNTANARIQSVARSMGLFGEEAGVVADRLSALAEATELQTGVDRNSIKLTQAKLLTFKELAKSAAAVGGNFDRATAAAVDLAAAGFGSAEQNATQLGKALNNPIKGITALSRAGVTFTEQEKDKLRQLVESNRMMEAQEVILKAIETQVGGAAVATADASVRIKGALSQGFEAVGKPLADALDAFAPKFLAFMEGVKPKMAEASQFLVAVFKSGNATRIVLTALKLGFAESVNFLWATLRATIAAMGQYIVEWFRTAITVFEILTTPDFWKGMGNALIGIFLSAVGLLQKGIAEAIEIARPLAEIFGQSDKLDSAQKTLRGSAQVLDDEAAERFGRAGDQLGPVAEKVATRMTEAGSNIAKRFADSFAKTPKVMETGSLQLDMAAVVADINKAIPKPKERKMGAGLTEPDEEDEAGNSTPRLAPVVSSLARVGGGGYGGQTTLDAQRENNRLTGETNRLLKDIGERMNQGGGRTVLAFG